MDNLSPEQIKQMIAMLQSMLPSSTIEQESGAVEPLSNTIKTVSPSKIKQSQNFVNKFDEMMEAKLHQEDKNIDKVLSVHSPTPRLRKFEPINVVCRVCGKKETVNPSMMSESPSRYKCNNCARSPG
jgi:lysyl-tRNA synthetase class I